MKLTVIQFPHFNPIYVVDTIDKKTKNLIQEILNSMSYDEYAGYSPNEQKKRKYIAKLLKDYEKPKIEVIISK